MTASSAAAEMANLIRIRLRERRTRVGSEVKIADLLDHLAGFELAKHSAVDFASALCLGEDAGWWVVVAPHRCLFLTERGAWADA